MDEATTVDSMRDYYARRAVYYERVYFAELGDRRFDGAFAGCRWSHVPLRRLAGWLDALHTRLESGARVVLLDNSYVRSSRTPSNTPISRREADGNTYQRAPSTTGASTRFSRTSPAASRRSRCSVIVPSNDSGSSTSVLTVSVQE